MAYDPSLSSAPRRPLSTAFLSSSSDTICHARITPAAHHASILRPVPAITVATSSFTRVFSRNIDSDVDAKRAFISSARHVPPPTVRQLAEP
jgi:hypothetical protein